MTTTDNVFIDFEPKVIQWALDRNIITGASIEGQIRKLEEEFEELKEAVKNNDQYEITDAIGDMSVVLTILAAMRGSSLSECQLQAYMEIKDRKGRMINGVFVKERDLPDNLQE